MTRLRDLENTYHETVSEKAQMILEKFIKNQLDIELPDELRVVSTVIAFTTTNTLKHYCGS